MVGPPFVHPLHHKLDTSYRFNTSETNYTITFLSAMEIFLGWCLVNKSRICWFPQLFREHYQLQSEINYMRRFVKDVHEFKNNLGRWTLNISY